MLRLVNATSLSPKITAPVPAFFLDTPYLQTTPSPLTRLRGRGAGMSGELVVKWAVAHGRHPR